MEEYNKYLKEKARNEYLKLLKNINDKDNLFIFHDFSNGINLFSSSNYLNNKTYQNNYDNFYLFHDSSNGISDFNLDLDNKTLNNINLNSSNNEIKEKDLYIVHDSTNGIGNFLS